MDKSQINEGINYDILGLNIYLIEDDFDKALKHSIAVIVNDNIGL